MDCITRFFCSSREVGSDVFNPSGLSEPSTNVQNVPKKRHGSQQNLNNLKKLNEQNKVKILKKVSFKENHLEHYLHKSHSSNNLKAYSDNIDNIHNQIPFAKESKGVKWLNNSSFSEISEISEIENNINIIDNINQEKLVDDVSCSLEDILFNRISQEVQEKIADDLENNIINEISVEVDDYPTIKRSKPINIEDINPIDPIDLLFDYANDYAIVSQKQKKLGKIDSQVEKQLNIIYENIKTEVRIILKEAADDHLNNDQIMEIITNLEQNAYIYSVNDSMKDITIKQFFGLVKDYINNEYTIPVNRFV